MHVLFLQTRADRQNINIETYRQIYRYRLNRSTDTDRSIARQTDRSTDREMQIDRSRDIDRQLYRQSDRQIDRQRQIVQQTDRQIDRQTRQTDKKAFNAQSQKTHKVQKQHQR